MRLLKLALAALLLAGQAVAAYAQTYPITTPVYIPSAIEQPTTCTTTCDVVFTVSGVSTVTLQLVGSPSGITAAVQGTNEAQSVAVPTWTALNMVPVNGGSAVTSTSAVGFWTVNTTGLTKVRAHISSLTGSVTVNMTGSSGGTVSFSSNSVVLADVEANIAPGTAPAKAAVVGAVYNSAAPTLSNGQTAALQENASGQLIVASANLEMAIAPGTAPAKAAAVGGVYNSAAPTLSNGQTAALQLDADGSLYVNLRDDTVTATDPCQSRNVAKSSAFQTISSATTTSLVPVSGTTAVYVCGISIVNAASQTTYLEYGTGASCTGTTAITPTYIASTMVNAGFGGGTVVKAPASNGVCMVTSSTGAAQVLISYVQQ